MTHLQNHNIRNDLILRGFRQVACLHEPVKRLSFIGEAVHRIAFERQITPLCSRMTTGAAAQEFIQ